MRFRTLLFDLDGTLIDHFAAIHRCHSLTMTHFGLPAPTMQQVRDAVGGGVEEAMQKLYGPAHAALLPQALPYYRTRWPEVLPFGLKLLPGAAEILGRLHAQGVTCAVFTNKHGPSAREICTLLGLAPSLRETFGAFDTPWLKPQREFADHVLQKLGAAAATTLLVGDSPYDVRAALNAGFPCWAVTTGTHTAAELHAAGAERVFSNLAEVQAALSDHSPKL